MPKGHQDQRGVPVTVAPYPLGGLDEAFNLVARQVFSRPPLDIRDSTRWNFPIYGS